MIEKIIHQFYKKGIRFSINEGKLKVAADVPPNEEVLNVIRENKSLIIDYIQQRKVILSPIQKLPAQSDFPASSAQRRLWVLSRFDGANEAYNIPQVVRLVGEVNETAFSTAYHDLLTRHEVLRTIFTEDAKGNPRQRILAATDKLFTIQIEDYSTLPKEERSVKIEGYVQQAISSGF
ncbi:MAG: condensation domain-containing protein, partial [Flavobacteriales bacterium]